MGKLSGNLFFAFAMASLFSIQILGQIVLSQSSGQSGGSGRINHETIIHLAVKSKCKASVLSVRCAGGIKFDEQKQSGWKKDFLLANYYEYTGAVEPDLFNSHHDKRNAFLKTACVSDHFETDDWREIFTCVEDGKKQEIKFELHPKEGGYSLVCDAEGGKAWLKLIYPKVAWEEAPKTPHFYRFYGLEEKKREELGEFIRLSVGNPPAGCRRLDCPLFVPIPDGCEREKP